MKEFNFKGKKICDYIVYTNSKNKHIAVFKDYEHNIHEVEISSLIKEALINEKRKEKKQHNEFDRHIEHSEIYENKLPFRLMDNPISLEDEFVNKQINKELKNAINTLSELQKRRINMYYFQRMTQQEIADKEGTSLRAVQYTLNHALEKLKKFYKNL